MRNNLIIILGIVLLVGFVTADNNCIPNFPKEFYGTVYVGENPLVGNNYILVAVIGGAIVGAQPIDSSDGSYSIDISPCPGIKKGAIEFFVGDVEIEESRIYEYDSSNLTAVSLNLHLDKYPNSVCGNEELNKGEECDDGNGIYGDGCSEICEVELGWECIWNPIQGSLCNLLPFCGDATCNNGETCSTCTSDCGACPVNNPGSGGGGGSGGGFGGGAVPLKVLNTTNDSNNNSDGENEAVTNSNTENEEVEVSDGKSFFSSITGAAIGGGVTRWIVAVIFVLLVISGFVLVRQNRNSKN